MNGEKMEKNNETNEEQLIALLKQIRKELSDVKDNLTKKMQEDKDDK